MYGQGNLFSRFLKNNYLLKMAKEFTKKLANKGATIRYQMDRDMSNAQISKSLGIPESTIRY